MSARVGVLCMAGVWPHVTANGEAANVVAHEIIATLARDGRFDVSFVAIGAVSPPEAARNDLQRLEDAGVRMLEPLDVPPLRPVSRLQVAVTADPLALLPGAAAAESVARLARGTEADVVLTIWSEAATAAAAQVRAPKIAYYGNIDYRVAEARFDIVRRLERGPRTDVRLRRWVRQRLYLQALRRAHLTIMRSYQLVTNVSAVDAAVYRRHRVPAVYLQNMWPAPLTGDWQARRDAAEQTRPLKIVGNVGNLSATGNTFGLETLAREIVPELRQRLGRDGFEVHLFGGHRPHPGLEELLRDPNIVIRGFVDDLDAELVEAPVFLVANNRSRFRVGHTRFLHAWSLGSCCVAFKGSREAMPELVHGENVLLGSSSAEIVDWVARAGTDRALRRNIGRGGRTTLVEKFAPAAVAGSLADHVERLARRRGAPGR